MFDLDTTDLFPAAQQEKTSETTTTVQQEPVVLESTEAIQETAVTVTASQEVSEQETSEQEDLEIQFAKLTKLAEEQFNLEVQRAQEVHCEAAILRNEAAAELKVAKASEKLALDELVKLKLKGPDYPKREEFFAKKKELPGVGPSADPASAEDTAWRSIKTYDVICDIDGLGKKKIEAIVDEYPSLGKLIDAKIEANSQFQHFKKILPKGIGESLADKIETAMLDACANPEKWLPTSPPLPLESQPEPEAAESVANDQQSKKKRMPINELWQKIADDNTDQKTPRKNKEAWEDGREAGLDELPIEKCPWEDEADREDYVRGYIVGYSTASL